MIPTPPKTSREILVEETKTTIANGVRQESGTVRTTLDVKIEEYSLKLGQANAHVLGAVVQLLTRGKVRIDFRDYSERLQLISQSNRMDRTEAVMVFDEHILNRKDGEESAGMELTQKIMVQPPRVTLPRP